MPKTRDGRIIETQKAKQLGIIFNKEGEAKN